MRGMTNYWVLVFYVELLSSECNDPLIFHLFATN